GGSSGYGREFRERLNGQWGVVDLQDSVNAACYLVEQGEADPGRILIRGGSAGGYTTICALTFTREFAAGASYFGLADLEPFATGDTHKFESKYEYTLVGPYPEAAELYRERSPVHFADRIKTPMLVLQGADDKVVPLSQAKLIVAALEANGIPHAYLLFEGEGHGFRKSESIVRAYEAELSFYAQVLRLELGQDIRASFLLAGPLLARFGRVTVPPPGGDVIGRRRLDTHIHAFQELGVEVELNGAYEMRTNGLRGKRMYLDEASVMGTENAIMAAVLAEGETIVGHAACEPHIQDLCRFLVSLGARIGGIGSDVLHIEGVD